MNIAKVIGGTTALLVMLAGCSEEETEAAQKRDRRADIGSVAEAPSQTYTCETGQPVSGKFYVQGEDINFRTGPGTDRSLVVNQKATRTFGETHYRTLWPSMVLDGMCETDEWLQAKISEADGRRVDWETGWVHKSLVSENQSADMRAGLLWNIDGDSAFSSTEKKLIRKGAMKVLRDDANCESIVTGYRSGSRKGAYYVTCNARNGGEPYNVWFTPAQVSSGSMIEAPKAMDESRSRQLCEQAIAGRAAHPSTLDIHRVTGYATTVHNNGNRTVVQEFSATNSFGQELEYQATCLVIPDGSAEVSIRERR